MTDFNQSDKSILSIRLSTDGFSFSVPTTSLPDSKPMTGTFTTDETLSLTANVKHAFEETQWLNRSYDEVYITMTDVRTTPVPLEFFDPAQAEDIFHYNLCRKDNEQVLHNRLPKSGIALLFGMDKSTYAFLHKLHPNARFFAQQALLAEYFTVQSATGARQQLYAYQHSQGVDVYAYAEGRLVLTNQLACTEAADRLYYLLYLWKQLEFDQLRGTLCLTGHADGQETLPGELRKYIKQVVCVPLADIESKALNLLLCE